MKRKSLQKSERIMIDFSLLASHSTCTLCTCVLDREQFGWALANALKSHAHTCLCVCVHCRFGVSHGLYLSHSQGTNLFGGDPTHETRARAFSPHHCLAFVSVGPPPFAAVNVAHSFRVYVCVDRLFKSSNRSQKDVHF